MTITWVPVYRVGLKESGLDVGASHVILVVKNLSANAGLKKRGFNPWVRKIPWRRAWQSTPVFLPGKSHGQRSLAGYTVHGVTKSWAQLSDLAHSTQMEEIGYTALMTFGKHCKLTLDFYSALQKIL